MNAPISAPASGGQPGHEQRGEATVCQLRSDRCRNPQHLKRGAHANRPKQVILLFDQDGHPVVPTCAPSARRAQRRSSMPEGHRRRRREACWTAASTAAPSPQKDAVRPKPAPFIRGSSPPLTPHAIDAHCVRFCGVGGRVAAPSASTCAVSPGTGGRWGCGYARVMLIGVNVLDQRSPHGPWLTPPGARPPRRS